jgi:hypothetical protein
MSSRPAASMARNRESHHLPQSSSAGPRLQQGKAAEETPDAYDINISSMNLRHHWNATRLWRLYYTTLGEISRNQCLAHNPTPRRRWWKVISGTTKDTTGCNCALYQSTCTTLIG